MIPKPGDAFGRYDVVRRLGRGGMGVVFTAVHRDLQREVALKVLVPDLSDDASYRNRFLREAQALARLDSPHVVRVFDAGEHDGWLFIATELVPDGDLADLLRRSGPLAIPDAVAVVEQVAAGLGVAHAAGILHRDIKPSNVLVRRLPDGALRAVLCDFGIAAMADAEHTATAGVIGTPGYMAPERHEGAEASVASDVYSLGCLLWALLTGNAPYIGSAAQVLMGHLQGPIPQLAATTAAADAVNAVLEIAMAKDPRKRPADVATLVDTFTSLTGRGPIAPDDTVEDTVVAPFVPHVEPVPALDPTVLPTPPRQPSPGSAPDPVGVPSVRYLGAERRRRWYGPGRPVPLPGPGGDDGPPAGVPSVRSLGPERPRRWYRPGSWRR